ncbi:diguanylate cyclase [Undibacterium sp.]|uniref:diguanylate cyclase n=1 Tax=Undibacterium sp. TaxID=1914977 RepID=UPI002C1F7FDD|nr:diguanylate cyclase [Undibacterium sp.]HTD03973.1 diguanylate cyclase [Undibacterium sp.]
MNLSKAFIRPSLKLKILALVLLVIFASSWVLAYTVARRLERDMTELLAAQQFSQASFMAEDIQLKMQSRVASLKEACSDITPETLASADKARQFLRGHKELLALFTSGLVLISRNGIGLADEPYLPGFNAASYSGREYFTEAIATGGAAFGKPRVDAVTGRPVVAIANPVMDSKGTIAAVLVGYASISDASLFGLIEQATFGKSGYVAINAPKYGLIVTSSNPSRILDTLAKPGVNQMVDKFVAGYEGSGIAVNSKGMTTLTSAKQIPVAGWFVQIVLPTEEAFAPVVQMKRYAYGAAGVLAALAIATMWLIVRYTLRPLDVAAKSIYYMAKGKSPLHRLPIVGNDEVAKLLISFNMLVDQRQDAERALRKSTDVFQAILLSITESIFLFDASKKLVAINPVGAQRLDADAGDLIGKSLTELFPPDLAAERESIIDKVFATAEPVIHEDSRSGRIYSSAHYPVLNKSGKIEGLVVVATDITERTRAENLLEAERRLAQSTLNSLDEQVCVVDEAGTILMVNQAWQDFVRANGENPSTLGVGANYLDICEAAIGLGGDQASAFSLGLRAVLDGEQEFFSMEYPCNCGAVQRFFFVKILRSPSADGERAVIAHQDISERKQMEDQLRELATTDALTGLPNRRCFLAHVAEELHRIARKPDAQAAVLMVDIDYFKQVNDTYGHATGDAALRLFAVTLEQVSRDVDMKGRLGGEEFALLLPGSDLVAAQIVAERLRLLVAETPLIQEVHTIYLTVSIGISMLTAADTNVDSVLNRADQALYRAKNSGRNRVAI